MSGWAQRDAEEQEGEAREVERLERENKSLRDELERLRGSAQAPGERARKLTDELFVNGNGEQADRLVLTSIEGDDLGGWARGPIAHRIQRALDAERQEEREACRNAMCRLCAQGVDVNEDMQHRDSQYAYLVHCKAGPIRARGRA